MSAPKHHDQETQFPDPIQPEVPRALAFLEDMHWLLLFVSQSLPSVTAEQQSVNVRMEEMSAERTAPPGFERFPPAREHH